MHDYGFDDLGLRRIIGVTHPKNRASQNVLMKAGLARLRLGPLLRSAVAAFRGGKFASVPDDAARRRRDSCCAPFRAGDARRPVRDGRRRARDALHRHRHDRDARASSARKRIARHHGQGRGAARATGLLHASCATTAHFVGGCGLFRCSDDGEVEIAYRLPFARWGQGYATEMARALLDHGFGALGLARIIGLTYPENVPSQRVLEKIGMRPEGEAEYYGRTMRKYSATPRGTMTADRRAGARAIRAGADRRAGAARARRGARPRVARRASRRDAVARARRRVLRARQAAPRRRAGGLSHRLSRVLGPARLPSRPTC